MSSRIPTLRQYGEYLESLDTPLDLEARLLAEPNRNASRPHQGRFEDAPIEMEVLEPEGVEVMVVDREATRSARTGRRRWKIAAAAAVVVVAGAVLAIQTRSDDIRTVPPAGPAPTTASPSATATAPTTAAIVPRGPLSADAVLPPQGAPPSTVENGELVASISFSRFIDFPGSDPWRGSAINIYADGRVLWLPVSDAPGGIQQRRLSAEGVELVRSAFLDAVSDTGRTASELAVWDACACIIRVRDSALILSSESEVSRELEPDPLDPEAARDIGRLVGYVTTLPSSLPASAWEDRGLSLYVPSRYQVCVWREGIPSSHAVPDVSGVLAQLVGDPVAHLLDEQGWAHTASGSCVEIEAADARVLAQALADAGVRHNSQPPMVIWNTLLGEPSLVSIGWTPFLPDGELPLMSPG